MQLRDDEKSKKLIDYIAENKSKHHKLFSWVAKKTKFSYSHVLAAASGKVVYNQGNYRLLQTIANRIYALEQELENDETIQLVTMNAPMRA